MNIKNEIATLNALTSIVDTVFSQTTAHTVSPSHHTITTTDINWIGDFPPGQPSLFQVPAVQYYYSPTWIEFWKKESPRIERKLVEAFDGQFPGYPVSNLILEKDGTCVLELGAIGFDKKEIKVEINGEVLEITASHEKEEEDEKKVYAHHKLSERNWTFKCSVPEVYDADKLKVSLDKGKLTIRIPLKEENKLVQKKYDIE